MPSRPEHIVIIGSGPAGLGAAYELLKRKAESGKDFKVTIIDKNEVVGGLARTHGYKGYLFDVGPHRFFTKNREVQDLWVEVLGNDFAEVPRLTRILYRNAFFAYPVAPKDILTKLGIVDLTKSASSYIKAKLFLRNRAANTFEEWIVQNFGRRLYEIFFKTYTEKVWGIPCNEIGAEWAAQRIKNLNFTEVLKNALAGGGKSKAKSLVSKFWYPVEGAGQMYEAMAAAIRHHGGEIILGATITAVNHDGTTVTGVEFTRNGQKESLKADHVFSSMPLTHLVRALEPKPKDNIIEASHALYYRDHITVNLVVRGADLFPDNWIYVHAAEVKMARIANYNNFSDRMRPAGAPDTSGISVEYFVFQDDDVWRMDDAALITLAVEEMARVNLLTAEDVLDGFVMRETESYPTYYTGHRAPFDAVKEYVSRFANLELIGRGGMYKYNNMDHSIYSGMLGARNYLAGRKRFDVWEINEDADYLEEITEDKPPVLDAPVKAATLPARNRRRDLAFVIGLAAFWLAQRLVTLWAIPDYFYAIHFDEGNYLYQAGQLLHGQPHDVFFKGPLIYWCAAVAMRTFADPWMVRIVSFGFDLALWLGFYLIVRPVNRRLAEYGAVFLAMSPLAVYLSFHVLTDTPLAVFIMLASLSFTLYRGRGSALAAGTSTVLALAVKSTGLILFPLLAWIAITKRRSFLDFLIAILPGILFYRYLPRYWPMASDATFVREAKMYAFREGVAYYPVVLALAIGAIATGLLVLGIRQAWRRNGGTAAALVGCLALLYLFFSGYGYAEPRYTVTFLPFAALLFGYGVEALGSRRFRIVALTGFVVLAIASTPWTVRLFGHDQSTREIALYLGRQPTDHLYTTVNSDWGHYGPFGLSVNYLTGKDLTYVAPEDVPALYRQIGPLAIWTDPSGRAYDVEGIMKAAGIPYTAVHFLGFSGDRPVYLLGSANWSMPERREWKNNVTDSFLHSARFGGRYW